jgi:hypothetical protein
VSPGAKLPNQPCTVRCLKLLSDHLLLSSDTQRGYPDVSPKEGVRRPLAEIVHANKYDRRKHMSNRQVVEYIYDLRGKTMSKYVKARGAEDDIHR